MSKRLVRRLLVIGFGLTVIYIAILALLLAYEDQLVFRPATAEGEWRQPAGDGVRDVYWPTPHGDTIHGWWCPAPAATGAVLICHGNSHNLSTVRSAQPATLRQWHALGLSVLIFDYPGYGKSTGTPSETGCYHAAEAAYQWLVQQQHIAPERIVLFGKSLGTGVAVDVASRHEHRALVLVSPFTSLPDVVQACYYAVPAQWTMRNRFDSLAKITQCRQPLLIVHGTRDRRVPYALGKQLFDAANEPKQLLRMDGARHGRSVMARFFPELRRFLADKK